MNICVVGGTGNIYNLVDRGFHTWKEWHETAMEVIGTRVELVGMTTTCGFRQKTKMFFMSRPIKALT